MKIVTSNIEQFKIFFDVVFDVASDTVELKFYPDKMVCGVLDGSRARFFYVEYEMKFFDEFDVDRVGSEYISLEDINKLLKLCNKTDTLTLEINDDKMIATVESTNGNTRLFEFVLPSDYTYLDTPAFPDVSLPYSFEFDTKDIERSVKDIELIGIKIFQFVIGSDNVTFMSDGVGSYNQTNYAHVIPMETDAEEVLAVKFSLDFIKQITKFSKISKNVLIDIGEQALIYKFDDELMGVTVRGMIAPRIEEEE